MSIHAVIFDTKDDPIHQNSSQEPSTSSNYDCVLDVLIFFLGSWNFNTTQEWKIVLIYDIKFDIRYDPILHNSSQEPPMSFKCDCVLDALLIMLESRKAVYNAIMTYDGYLWCQIWYQIWPNHSKLQSGTINVLQLWLCFWWTFIHVREFNIRIQPNNDILLWSMMSNWKPKTSQSSRSPVRNY